MFAVIFLAVYITSRFQTYSRGDIDTRSESKESLTPHRREEDELVNSVRETLLSHYPLKSQVSLTSLSLEPRKVFTIPITVISYRAGSFHHHRKPIFQLICKRRKDDQRSCWAPGCRRDRSGDQEIFLTHILKRWTCTRYVQCRVPNQADCERLSV